MSRIRSLKPTFFTSSSLAKVSRDARTTFQGLWCEADDAGRGKADQWVLKGALWPHDVDITVEVVEAHLRELAASHHIELYVVDGDRFYAVKKWSQHQAAALRRSDGKFPPPSEGIPWSEGQSEILHDSARLVVQESAGVVEGSSGVVEGSSGKHTRGDSPRGTPPGFDDWWDRYPRKLSKADAVKAWRSAVKLGLTPEQARASLEAWQQVWATERRPADKVPYPATWLNKGCWREIPGPAEPDDPIARVLGQRPRLAVIEAQGRAL